MAIAQLANGEGGLSCRNKINAAIDVANNALQNRIEVTTASQFAGTLDSTKEYFLDGVIDMGTQSIEVPAGGIFITGFNFDISGLTSTEPNYTMFTSPVGGSGDIILKNMFLTTSGATSQVYDVVGDTGTEAFELSSISYNDCTSLGTIDTYRQGLEIDTGRFGGSPTQTLKGTWIGGYRITTSIVRGLSAGMTGALFEAGAGFTMASRFLTDINCDLPALAAILDFSDTNFTTPSTLELRDTIVTRNGSVVPNDANLTPNIAASNLSCNWVGNNGVPNTFVGAIANITTEVTTTIVTQGVPVAMAGTVTTDDLQHFDSPSNGQLRHLGANPREFTVNFDFITEGTSGDDYKLSLVKDDGVSPVIAFSQTRVINNLQGSRNVAYFTGLGNVILDQNDKVYWEISNESDADDCATEVGSSWRVSTR